MDKPDVDFIEGLSPAISIDQKSASRNPRSTVGTITEIYDYLRLLYAAHRHPALPELRAGHHPPDAAADRRPRARSSPEGTRFQVLAPVVRGRKGEYEGLLEELAGQGFTRARVDGELVELRRSELERLARYEQHTIEVVVDRLVRRPGIERRLTDSLETALRLAEGVAEVEIVPREDEPRRARDAHVLGAPRVHALRPVVRRARAAQLLVQLAVRRVRALRRARDALRGRSRARRRPTTTSAIARRRDRAVVGVPQRLLRPRARRGRRRVRLLHRHAVEEAEEEGQEGRALRHRRARRCTSVQEPLRAPALVHHAFEGVIPWLERRHTEAESDRVREQIEGYMREVPCPACDGARLRPASLAVTIGGKNIYEVGELSIRKAREFFGALELSRARPA